MDLGYSIVAMVMARRSAARERSPRGPRRGRRVRVRRAPRLGRLKPAVGAAGQA
jgi:hypothetical protein